MIAALRAARIDVQHLPGLDAHLQLRLPGEDWQGVNLTGSTIHVRSGKGKVEPYVYASGLVNLLRGTFKGTLSLTGMTNPILHIGPSQMQLGTPLQPVQAADVLLLSVLDEVMNRMLIKAGPEAKWPMTVSSNELQAGSNGTFLALKDAAPRFYAVVGTNEGNTELSVQSSQAGRLTLCHCTLNQINLTGDLSTLMDWTKIGTSGVMVYALDVTDLHRLDLKPVPTAQLHLETQ